MYSEAVSTLIENAIRRIFNEMRQDGPYMAEQAERWFEQLAGGARPARYFQHPLAFPMLLLPWWMEQTLHDPPDVEFQGDLIYSSINGYYFIRMIDNVMDGEGEREQKLLPMLGFFHTELHRTYQPYFEAGHPFWDHFRRLSRDSAETALRDGALIDIDEDQFQAIAGRKVCGGKIPLAAVAQHYQRPDLFESWEPFYDRLGCWHQMYNDIFGWIKDMNSQASTYFLAEGRRRMGTADSLTSWVIQEGFDWGTDRLARWLDELIEMSTMLESRELMAYLVGRRELMEKQRNEVLRAFHSLERLLVE